jgi:hypothetical protein
MTVKYLYQDMHSLQDTHQKIYAYLSKLCVSQNHAKDNMSQRIYYVSTWLLKNI